jgi:hypothetical protein
MKQLLVPIAAAAAMLGLGDVHAENFGKSAYEGAKSDIKATYKADRERCSNVSGNAKDVCVEIAKAQEKIALAQLDYNYTGAEKDALKLMKAQYEGRYDVAKEKCDDLSGQQKDVCVREAKTAREKAEADVKLGKKVTDAFADADQAKLKADYKLAKERCDMLAGDAKEACIASAKARFRDNS